MPNIQAQGEIHGISFLSLPNPCCRCLPESVACQSACEWQVGMYLFLILHLSLLFLPTSPGSWQHLPRGIVTP